MTDIHIKNQKQILARLTEEADKIKASDSYVPGSQVQIPIETVKLIAKELGVGEGDVFMTLGIYLRG